MDSSGETVILWLIGMDKILKTLDWRGIVVAYADDLVILVPAIFSSVMTEIIGHTLGKK